MDPVTGNDVSGITIVDDASAETHVSACGGVNFTIITNPDTFETTTTTGTDCVTSDVNEFNLESGVAITPGDAPIFLTRAPVELFSDDFNRADAANLGANYDTISGVSTHSIVSNQCDHPTLGGADGNTRNTPAAPNAQYGQVTMLATPGAGAYSYLLLRSNNAAADAYGFGWDHLDFGDNFARIVRINGGVVTNLAVSGSISIAPGDVIYAFANVNFLRIFVNGAIAATAFDGTFTTGQWGLRSFFAADTPAFEDFSGGSV